MNQAVDECIEGGYLTDVLKEQKAAAMLEALTSYNKKAYERDLREEGHEIGLKEGLEKGRKEMQQYYDDKLYAKEKIISQKDQEIAKLKAELEKLSNR